jgi:Fe-Mn family superoxide dismutase
MSDKFEKKDKDFVLKFLKFLQKEFPLKEDLSIEFVGERYGEMSTGSRTSKHKLKILAKDRLNRDIMRTLAHEWVHEYQMTILGRKHGKDIGGKNENEANSEAGRLIKQFEKEHPDLEKKMYESKLEKRTNVLLESIILHEKSSVKENLLVEMKKIGIEKLPYSYSSLSRFIDSKTMDVHYNKHYKGYVQKLNKALKDKDGDMSLEEIIKSIGKFDDKVRNNAGGAFNHALFWKMLSPKKQLPKGEILKKIKSDFGNIKKLKDEFNQSAQDRFGSGWAWLYLTKDGKLKIMSTPNQDNPLMNIIKGGGHPLLGLDVWEHAYYLKYQNKRDEYINKFWDCVNWEFVEDLYLSYSKKKNLKESLSDLINESDTKQKSKLDLLCSKTIKQGKEDSPYCKLLDFRDSIDDNHVKDVIDTSVDKLDNFYRFKNVGMFPTIINLSLVSKERTGEFLKLISEFIDDEEFSKDETRKILRKQKNTKSIPSNTEDLLAAARAKEYDKYERRFEGKHFKRKPTRLQLNYHCSDDAKEKLIDTLLKIHNGKEALDYHFFRITGCLTNSFKSGTYYIKADVESTEDLKDEDGNVVFPSGTNFEIKKMDPFIDSYLSEFFSIFKQSENIENKSVVGNLYNTLIDKIYNWLINNQNAKNYLQKVKDQIGGIIYDEEFIVPIEYIQLYWSNKGQRGCDEKRLSIRFRINPEFNEIKGYRYIDEDTLENVNLPVPTGQKELVICPTK